MRPTVFILVVLGVLLTGGCRQRSKPRDRRQQIADDYGQLPGLTGTPHPKLRDELAQIVAEGGTPELLCEEAQGQIADDAQNVAAGLAGLFGNWKIASILDISGEIFPVGQFTFSPTRLEKAIRFRKTYEVQRQRVRDALGRPDCNFGIQYQAGFAADLRFIDTVRISVRLEAFQAAESLADADLGAAIDSLGFMLRLVACLAAEKHATARLEAAFARTEALAVLQSIVEHPQVSHPKITRQQVARLCTLIHDQLTVWPPDADAWIGDRALGMHAYEMVRVGNLMHLVTEEEFGRFRDEDILAELPAAAQRTVNQDELYYLDAMRKIIEACNQPYYKRIAVFEAIRKDLHERRNSHDFPVVAGRLLLPDIEKGHRIQARDRANCEAWALALALAAERKPPPYKINPLTGSKYEIVRQEGVIAVWDIGTGEAADNPPVVVPDLAEGQ